MKNMLVIATASLVLLTAGCKQETAQAPESKTGEPQTTAPATPPAAPEAAKPEPTQ